MSEKYWRRADLEKLRHNRRIILELYDDLAEQRKRNGRLLLAREAEKVNLNDQIKALKAGRR